MSANAILELANRLYREYHTRCFWHSPRELVITEELIPLVVKGLRKYGGHRGFMLAAELQPRPASREVDDENHRHAADRVSE